MEIAGQDAELPEIRRRSRLFGVVVFLGLLGLATRLFYVQVVEGDAHYQATTRNVLRTAVLPAVRGEIRDRNGRVLATTRPAYNVRITPSQLTESGYKQLVKQLGLDIDTVPSWEKLAQLARAEKSKEILLGEDISRDAMAALGTLMDGPGARIFPEARRHYPFDTLFAHSVGYMNEVTAEEIKVRKDEGYRPGDLIGRTGMERQWEAYLRGSKGFETSVVDRGGLSRTGVRASDLVEGPTRRDPIPGSNVVLTLDVDLQKIVDRALRAKSAAAVVVMDVATGRVLALASRPGFSPNSMSGHLSIAEEAAIVTDRRRPFIDKAVAETYNPGSTFKIISALAALEDRVLGPEERVKCAGFVQAGRRRFKCTKVHGVISLHGAIVQSCNVYFYELGARPGMMNRLAKFATEFGLGAPTGVGFVGEASGFVPTEEWHRQKKQQDPRSEGFVIGHALNTVIGEGATRATVIQIANLYLTLAAGGKLWLPQIVERVEAPDGSIIEEFPPRVRRDLSISPATMSFLKSAFTGVVNEPKGTAYKARSKRILIAGKTGTAQVHTGPARPGEDPPLPSDRLDHAWFAGFAPADKPKIAFAVLVEHGGHGGDVAAPVAVEIVENYFSLLDQRAIPAVAAPERAGTRVQVP